MVKSLSKNSKIVKEKIEEPIDEEEIQSQEDINEEYSQLDDIEDEVSENEMNNQDHYDDAIDENTNELKPLDFETKIMEVDTETLQMRIGEVLNRLGNISNTNDSRVNLLIELKKLFSRLYNYNYELMEYILDLLGPVETQAFLESMELPRPVTIRVNSLKVQKAALIKSLTDKNVSLEPLNEICKMAFKINSSKVPIGATTEYLAGQYMLQSAASMLAVRALAPQPDEKILDLSAAPGGKTTYIGQLMKNKGIIVANDLKKERTKALFYNCQRMGLTNVIITNYDGRYIPGIENTFDRVLLDAPCTGLGVISRDASIKARRTMMDIKKASHLQRELLRKAVDYCKVGGYIVYSTCSFAVEENEAVIDYICKKRFVKIVDTGIEFENKAFTKYKDSRYNDRIKYCLRVMPHIHNMDGFFVAKLLKIKNGERDTSEIKKSKEEIKKTDLKKCKINKKEQVNKKADSKKLKRKQ